MVQSSDRVATAEHEFALLAMALNETAEDAVRCLKLLKRNLSDYDRHHGNHFVNTATLYMRNDMRTAKDTTCNLKHVAHQIRETSQPSDSGIISARSMMDVVAKSMDALTRTARTYDEKNGRSKGVKGVMDDTTGKNDKEKHEKDRGLFGASDTKKTDAVHGGGLIGQMDGVQHHHGDGLLSNSDTVEQLVKTTLHDNFNTSALSHRITLASKSLTSSPSFVERAKEVIHDVKDKLTGDKTSPTHHDHHGRQHGIEP